MADDSIFRHLETAHKDLKLTPEERDLYIRHLTNLWGDGGVDHANGDRSTLYAVTTDIDGRGYIIPSVRDGKILPPDDAIDAARADGLHQYPSYPNADEALQRYMAMHEYMNRDTGDYMAVRRGPLEQPRGLINTPTP